MRSLLGKKHRNNEKSARMNDENIIPHQFKPGETGNPKGRPKGSKSLKTMLTELLSSQDPDGEWAKSVGGQLIRKAFRDGNLSALQEIIDRVEGKITQKTEMDLKGEIVMMPSVKIDGKDLEIKIGD